MRSSKSGDFIAQQKRAQDHDVVVGYIDTHDHPVRDEVWDLYGRAVARCGRVPTLIEALACGTTPLVTDIPSFRRITGEGHAGALVPLEDAPALAQAIVRWSERGRAELRRDARRHFERELSFDANGRDSTGYEDLNLSAILIRSGKDLACIVFTTCLRFILKLALLEPSSAATQSSASRVHHDRPRWQKAYGLGVQEMTGPRSLRSVQAQELACANGNWFGFRRAL